MPTRRITLPALTPPPPVPIEIAPLELQILADGRLLLDGRAIASDVFAAEIAHVASMKKPPGINVAVADNTEYQHVVDVLAVIKGEGLRRISFVDMTR